MNNKLFMLLFGLGQKHRFFGKAATVVAKYSYNFFYIVYISGLFITVSLNIKFLPFYIVVPLAGFFVSNTARKLLDKKRPFMELDITPLITHKDSPSCPSNHATCAMVIALTFMTTVILIDAYNLIRLSEVFIFCAFVTGLSRVVCGIHYPKDIVLGWLIGFICYLLGIAVYVLV